MEAITSEFFNFASNIGKDHKSWNQNLQRIVIIEGTGTLTPRVPSCILDIPVLNPTWTV